MTSGVTGTCKRTHKSKLLNESAKLPVELLGTEVRMPLDNITASSIDGNSASATGALASNSAAAVVILLASTSG